GTMAAIVSASSTMSAGRADVSPDTSTRAPEMTMRSIGISDLLPVYAASVARIGYDQPEGVARGNGQRERPEAGLGACGYCPTLPRSARPYRTPDLTERLGTSFMPTRR